MWIYDFFVSSSCVWVNRIYIVVYFFPINPLNYFQPFNSRSKTSCGVKFLGSGVLLISSLASIIAFLTAVFITK